MTEKELVDLGFERVEITDDESQNGYDYYYYQKEMCSGLVLHSSDSVDTKNNDWILRCFELPSININTRDHYDQFLEIMNNITC
jgi:hypothetical protein